MAQFNIETKQPDLQTNDKLILAHKFPHAPSTKTKRTISKLVFCCCIIFCGNRLSNIHLKNSVSIDTVSWQPSPIPGSKPGNISLNVSYGSITLDEQILNTPLGRIVWN